MLTTPPVTEWHQRHHSLAPGALSALSELNKLAASTGETVLETNFHDGGRREEKEEGPNYSASADPATYCRPKGIHVIHDNMPNPLNSICM